MINGFALGHHTADGPGWLTGSTVVLAPDGAVAGVDVRGGGPGTRETDLLDPRALVERVHAVLLTGGSAYGLAAADGVMRALEAAGTGFAVPGGVVPIVPAAVVFDLGRGGAFDHRPTAEFGALAVAAARPVDPERGTVGAGTGAVCGGLKGGFGWSGEATAGASRLAAAVVVNAVGSPVDPRTGRLWADRDHRWRGPTGEERASLAQAYAAARPALNTTLGVVLTDASLTKAQSAKVAAVAHDGLARAVRPVHAMTDGDTMFCLASGRAAAPDGLSGFNALLAAAATAVEDACLDALLSATGRGPWPAYADLVPAAVAD